MNKIIVNPDKFQAKVLSKKLSDLTNPNCQVNNPVIKLVSTVEVLRILIDDKLEMKKSVYIA